MGTLKIGNRKIEYVVNKSSDSKYAQLRLKRDLRLEVILPLHSSVDVNHLLKKKRRWIESKFDEMLNSRRIFDSRRLLYRGVYHNVVFGSSSTKRIRVDSGKIIMPPSNGIEWKEVLKDWMGHETRRFVDKKLQNFANAFGLSFNEFTVQDTRKWAYCTKDGRVVFNSQLIALPQKLADYVILHEITHLEEFNHSKRFKYKLASICPDFKDREMALKRFIAD